MKKAELRKLYKAKRKELSHTERASLSESICKNLLDNFDLSEKQISIFLPVDRFTEVITWSILEDVQEADFFVPVVIGDLLKHIKYESKEQLKISDWGIPEPTHGFEGNPEQFDLVIVPLLCADESGNRVGYGKGFYDGFLKNCREDCVFVGLSFFDPVKTIDDIHENDIALNFMVTSQKVFSFKKD